MSVKKAELVADVKALHGEGPLWDPENRCLYWIDGMGGKIHIYDNTKGEDSSIDLGEDIGCIVLREKGGLAAALRIGFCFVDSNTYGVTLIKNPETDMENIRFNDGKCDCMGRFWAGTMATDEHTPSGALYCLDRDLKIKTMLKGVVISNGIAWNKDSSIMYYIDSPTKEVAAFDFNPKSCSLSNKRVAVRIPEGEGVPDGMTIDEEGMLWVAQWGGFKVSHWNPDTAEKLDEIIVSAESVSSCAFGGENLDELYITTARLSSSSKTLEEYPHAGGLFVFKPGIRGLESYKFAG